MTTYTSGLTRQVDVPAGTATLTFSTRYNIEDCGPNACDYAYVEVNDGNGWKAIPGDITSATEGNGIDGCRATAGSRRVSTSRRTPARR